MVDTKVAAHSSDASGVNGSVFEKFPAHETTVARDKSLECRVQEQKWMSRIADWRASLSRKDPDVVELCCAHA